VSTTVIVALHVELLPEASVAVIVTVFAPMAAIEPAAGDWVTVTTQASLVTTPAVRSGIRAEQALSTLSVCDEAQLVMLGAVVSTTVKVVVQVELLPAASVTVIVTVVTPRLAALPASGDCVTVKDGLQLSLASTPPVKSGSGAAQPAPASTVCAAAQAVIAGAVVSLTVKVTVCVVELPLPSAAVMTTEVTPRPTAAPAKGDCVTVTGVQLSVATT
jgi:hypothetical protein